MDIKEALLTALKELKRCEELEAQNERLRTARNQYRNQMHVYEETNRKACARIDHLEAQNRALAKGWDDIAGQLNQALRKLADLRLSLVKPGVLHPMCFSCEHWESPAEWARRNPDEFDESPENGMCHENPRGDPSPASDWCSKHKTGR